MLEHLYPLLQALKHKKVATAILSQLPDHWCCAREHVQLDELLATTFGRHVGAPVSTTIQQLE